MFYQERPYFTGDKIKILKPKNVQFSKRNALFFLTAMQQAFRGFSWGAKSFSVEVIKKQIFQLPLTQNGAIDFAYMEDFVGELEKSYIRKLESYLSSNDFTDYSLSVSEKKALMKLSHMKWQSFNIETLFGKSTRGKRLKGDDRIPGKLPFVTAGEANTGISAFIGNKVEIFQCNTTTIDMFGSAKYRNYNYGADDHVAVVHTEHLTKYAAIFVTTSCHKAAHTGKYTYGNNFYATDADELNIMLPAKNGTPDYKLMETIISAVHKLVIKDVVDYAYNRLATTKQIIGNNN